MVLLLLSFSSILVLVGFVFIIGQIIHVFRIFNTHFAGERLSRNNSMSPSSCQLDPPNVCSWEPYNKYGYLEKQLPPNNKLHPNLFTPTAPVTPNNNRINNKTRATELNMDHVYMSFFQLLWAFIFVGSLSYLQWKKAIYMLKLRIFLIKVGVSKVALVDMNALVGKIVLEQSQVIHYVSQNKTTRKIALGRSDNENVGTFIFPGKECWYHYHILLPIVMSST